ncbi:MAG: CsgG/HfaB family protein [Planctomycetota bacterium]
MIQRTLPLWLTTTLLCCSGPPAKEPSGPQTEEERLEASVALLAEPLISAAQGQKLALLPILKEGRDYEPAAARYVASRLVVKLVAAGISVLERADLEHILQEQQLQISDLFGEENQAKVGRLAGADALVLGTARDSSLEAYEFRLKLVDLATARILTTSTATVRRSDLPVKSGGN